MIKGRIYTVHYGANTAHTDKFIRKIKPFLSSALELVIINNSPEYKIKDHQSANITILEAKSNLGYFGGFKYGLETMSGDTLNFVIICNNDIELINEDFFEILKERINKYDIIAPSILTLNNIEQNPHRARRPSAVKKIFYRVYFSHYYLGLILNKIINSRKRLKSATRQKKKNECEIFSPHGAFIILNKSFFLKGGKIDDGFFLYGEEDSIAAQSLQLDLKIGFVPSLQVLHWESISTGKKFSQQKYNFQKDAFNYTKDKFQIFDIY